MVMNMENCNLCPRNCGVDRSIKTGLCNSSDKIKLARASLHMWEEPCISGTAGSGTIFFSGCSLKCVYCQNSVISNGITGTQISQSRLYDIFFELKQKGAKNINLVTADHYIPFIYEPIKQAKSNGINIPFILNTSSYVKVETLKLVEGLIDVYLPDFKYFDCDVALRYSKAPDYPEYASNAIDYMLNISPKIEFDEDGYIKKGVIIRHLVLPGNLLNSKKVLKYISQKYGTGLHISIMSQYTPCTDLKNYPEINRRLTQNEYDRIVDFACDLGFENVYVQDGNSASESFIPPFDLSGI